MKRVSKVVLGSLVLAMLNGASYADEKRVATLQSVNVIGSKESVASLPGSGAFVNMDDIRSQSYDDVNEVLRRIPGVYVREEDGYGLFPNISLRGTDPARSGKVTLMEDGIPAAPAPYSAPSAYYSPTAGRMSGLEVLKGSSQVKYGPHTTGGVVNYLSTEVPTDHSLYLKTLYGTDNEYRVHAYAGDEVETDLGTLGYLFEEYFRKTDGFKTIDATPDFSDTDRTGFRKSEPMLKLYLEPKTEQYQRFEFKLGYSDVVADETYLGLSTTDFRDNPYRRYAASRFDEINSKNTRTYLRYLIEPVEDVLLTVTGYFNKFSRNWFKLHQLRSPTVALGAALADPSSLAILKGEAAGTLRYRRNRRDYETYGVAGDVDWNFETFGVPHVLEAGVRYHNDYVRRKQLNIDYVQNAQGVITSESVSADGSAGNRHQESDAWAFYLRDQIEMGDLTVIPGVRYEMVNYHYQDFGSGLTADVVSGSGEQELDVWAPGIGAIWQLRPEWQLYGGVHKGFSVPGPRDNARSGLDEEVSMNYEVGVRHENAKHFSSEATFFFTDFDDLIVTDNIGGSGSGTTENVGDINVIGVEWSMAYDAGLANEWGFSNPYELAFTYTQAELDGASRSTDSESIFFGGKDGAAVPYIPEYQVSLSSGLRFEKWGIVVDLNYVDQTFSTASNIDNNQGNVNGSGDFDERIGETDAFFTVDVSLDIKIAKETTAFLNLQNIFDQEYIVSRHPFGPRPGKPFTVLFGVEWKA